MSDFVLPSFGFGDGDTSPWLLDLCCNAGGASEGYVKAGFRVVGVDVVPQKNYPHTMQVIDARTYLRTLIDRGWVGNFAAIHISPPCQRYSPMSNCRPGLADEYPDLIWELRSLARETGLPYVIENVVGSPLIDPVMLCGFMFGRELYRHRLFEVGGGWTLVQPEHPKHTIPASKAGHWRPGTIMSVAGHTAPISKAREVMEIDWTTREELAEAIPPYYTEYVGSELLAHLRGEAVA